VLTTSVIIATILWLLEFKQRASKGFKRKLKLEDSTMGACALAQKTELEFTRSLTI